MMQIDTQPHPKPSPEGAPPFQNPMIGRPAGTKGEPKGDLQVDAEDPVLVAPPPLPFPRVFPGL
jgi:hypothetical protein